MHDSELEGDGWIGSIEEAVMDVSDDIQAASHSQYLNSQCYLYIAIQYIHRVVLVRSVTQTNRESIPRGRIDPMHCGRWLIYSDNVVWFSLHSTV